MNLPEKVNEAETYYSMGLFEESLSIYEQIISSQTVVDEGTRDAIHEKMGLIQNEIDDLDRAEIHSIGAEDIAFFKKTLSISDDDSDRMESAAAFIELGLIEEALAEYEKLLKKDSPWKKVIPDIATCLLKCCGPDEVLTHVQTLVDKAELSNTDRAEITFRLGLEMENRNLKVLARELYGSAAETDPGNKAINAQIQSLLSSPSTHSKYEYLINSNKTTTEQLRQALAQSKRIGKSVEHVLVEHFNVKIEDLGKSLSLFYGLRFRKYEPEIDLPAELVRNLKKSFLLTYLWVPLSWTKECIEVLIDNPKDLSKTDQIRTLMNTAKIRFSVGIKEHIEDYIHRIFDQAHLDPSQSDPTGTGEFDTIMEISFDQEEPEAPEEEAVDESSSQVVKLIDQVIITAFRKKVSDIHFEPIPEAQCMHIRFRMDGICQDHLKIPLSMARGILSRLKIMSRLDIAERRLPQDGKIKFRRKGVPTFELRLATLPTAGGYEDAVLRILSKANALALDEIGMTEKNLFTLQNMIAQPYGIVLVVGPTGSGKTTTLHSALGYINKPGVKIWTAEDPVEITQSRLRQVEAKPQIGLNFPRIMRAFLRADPDVIMIGEMRDQETANIALEASLTGHLVFSTLHTNSAAETITRLLDMGFNPIYFADALLVVLAQRLVRKLCQQCKSPYRPTEQEVKELINEYGEAHLASAGIEPTSDLVLYHPKGCDACSGIGYSGRLAIHELLQNTDRIKTLIKESESTEKITHAAMTSGMTTLKQDGILKVLSGITDITEVRRVCIR